MILEVKWNVVVRSAIIKNSVATLDSQIADVQARVLFLQELAI